MDYRKPLSRLFKSHRLGPQIPHLNKTTDIIDGLVGEFLSVFESKSISDMFQIDFDPFKKSDVKGYQKGFPVVL